MRRFILQEGHFVMCVSHAQVVEELLKAGPALNAIDADGCTAIHLAAQDGHLEVCHHLSSMTSAL